MDGILSAVKKSLIYQQNVQSGKFDGLIGSSKAAVVAALFGLGNNVVLLTPSTEEANWFKQEILIFDPSITVEIFPVHDALPGEGPVSPEIIGQRLKSLSMLFSHNNYLLIAPIRAAMYKTADISKEIVIKTKDTINIDNICSTLINANYRRCSAVGERGEFSVRGGILDIFPSNNSEPFRIELFGDEVESIRVFDPVSQRSISRTSEVKIFSNIEEMSKNIFQAIDQNITVVLDEEPILKATADRFYNDAFVFSENKNEVASFSELAEAMATKKKISLSAWSESDNLKMFAPAKSYVNEIEKIPKGSEKIIIVSRHKARLDGRDVVVGQLRGGFEFDGWIVLSDRELFGIEPIRPKIKAKSNEGLGEEIKADFEVGDFVVHEDYGIGIFRGLQSIEEGDYALIEFADNDKLFVPPNLMGKLEKYVSPDQHNPKLSKMGGAAWKTLKSKVKKSVKDLTQELLSIYAGRKKAKKEPYAKDDVWQKELEDSFPYEETADQLKAIQEVRSDLESDQPMDRLLCGDVGYGKTEVALRAIVKVASSGKQVAVLVPTTILAEQHFHNFSERLSSLPFKVASLSRFRSREEQKRIVEQLKLGEVDVVVGTHRLLQKDVVFKELGMLVIDEEHRFGVAHKEKLKKIKQNVDILSMSATPIPRTLYFSLSGARDLSLIQTPPADRSPVKTFVAQFNPALIREVILREIDRGGQVYFVHNFIESIDNIAAIIKKEIPEARIAIGHGQMKESQLEKVMDDFLNRKYDILLATSIIESGLDIPNVNTIIIDRAERLGLAQLYQLRGRVGRSPVKAYSYLLYHPQEILSSTALSRLQAISEFTSLGSGYKLALRDLEIRGAGNLLGAAQHGHILSVGFDLYCELLEEAVKEIKGIKEQTPRQVVIEINENAAIPAEYIEDEQQRIALYRRLNILGNEKELEDFKVELRDRFGKIPKQCLRLFEIIKLRIKAVKTGVKSMRGDSVIYIEWTSGKTAKIKPHPGDRINQIINILKI